MSTYIVVKFLGELDEIEKVQEFFNVEPPEFAKSHTNWIDGQDNFSWYSLADVTEEQFNEKVDEFKTKWPDRDPGTFTRWLYGNALWSLIDDVVGTSQEISDLEIYRNVINGEHQLTYQGYTDDDENDLSQLFKVIARKAPLGVRIDFYWENSYHDGAEGHRLSHSQLYVETDSWERPDSHAEFEKRGYLDECVCHWESDTDCWYEDCPREDEEQDSIFVREYTVDVVSSYKVLTWGVGEAERAVIALESGYDLPEYTIVLSKVYNEKYVVQEIENTEKEWITKE
jgi:hypothetical protein